jgi:Family of unknown function (DUF6893)
MTKTIVWAAAVLALVGMAISMGPDLKRYIKISTM